MKAIALLLALTSAVVTAQTGDACGDHHCFNGGTCVTVGGESYCDCTTATNNEQSFAGRFCQYEAGVFCEKNQDADGQAFCVNGGTCNTDGA